jgi:hypothetical protein
MFRKRLGDSRKTRLCCKVGADTTRHQDRGALLDESACFYHLLLFAVRIVPPPVEASFCSKQREERMPAWRAAQAFWGIISDL